MVIWYTDTLPDSLGLQVGLKALLGVPLEVRNIQSVLGQTINSGEEIPRHSNGLLLMRISLRRIDGRSRTDLEVVTK